MARGDHIKVKRFGGLYTHHGIDLGDGTVIHFDGEPLRGKRAVVKRSTIDEFLQGSTPSQVEYVESPRAEEETIGEALARIGETGYHLFRNNCEHFAHACKTGAAKSRQVERALRMGLAATAGVAVVGGALVLTAVLAKKNEHGNKSNA